MQNSEKGLTLTMAPARNFSRRLLWGPDRKPWYINGADFLEKFFFLVTRFSTVVIISIHISIVILLWRRI